jgi:MFS family permease
MTEAETRSPSRAEAPRGSRVFYGWWVLAASVVVELFGLGFGIFAITTVYPYVIDTFPDWSRTTIFAPTSIVIACAGVLAPVTGALVDRVPVRALFAVGIVLQTTALLWFSRVATPATYLAASALLGVGLACVTILPNQVLVSRWFRSRVGVVNGILLAATALGAAIAPPLITRLVEALGDWRLAFAWIAALAFVPPMLVTLLLVRDRPEDMGLRPLGEATTDTTHADEAGVSLGVAARTVTFWALLGAIFLGGLPCYSFNKHILVFLKEAGWAPVPAADMKSLFFTTSAVGRLIFGWLCDHYDRRRVFLAHLALVALAYPFLQLVPSHPRVLAPVLIALGLGYGALLPAMALLAITYFGRRHLGTILGVLKAGYDLAAATAPLFTAALYDAFGGYAVPDRINAAIAWVGLFVAVVWLGRRRPTAPATN